MSKFNHEQFEELQRKACLDDEGFAALVAEGIRQRRRLRHRMNRFFTRILPVCFHGILTLWNIGDEPERMGLKCGRFTGCSMGGNFWTTTWITWNGRGIALQTPHQKYDDPLEELI